MEIRFLQRRELFLFSTVSRLALGPTQLPVQGVPRPLFPEVSRAGSLKLATDIHPVSRLRIHGALPQFPSDVSMTWCLIKVRNNYLVNKEYVVPTAMGLCSGESNSKRIHTAGGVIETILSLSFQ
jgi:hypothetical protein